MKQAFSRHQTRLVEEEIQGDYKVVEGIRAQCIESGAEVEIYGVSGRSVRRALVTLDRECPGRAFHWGEVEEPEMAPPFPIDSNIFAAWVEQLEDTSIDWRDR